MPSIEAFSASRGHLATGNITISACSRKSRFNGSSTRRRQEESFATPADATRRSGHSGGPRQLRRRGLEERSRTFRALRAGRFGQGGRSWLGSRGNRSLVPQLLGRGSQASPAVSECNGKPSRSDVDNKLWNGCGTNRARIADVHPVRVRSPQDVVPNAPLAPRPGPARAGWTRQIVDNR